MSSVYLRRDFVLDVQPAGSDARFVLTGPDGAQAQAWLEGKLLDEAAQGDATRLKAALPAFAVATRLDAPSNEGFDLTRVTLQLGRRDWARIDWEALTGFANACFVRSCPVRPRVAQIPLTFPIRILESGGTPVVGDALDAVFKGSDRSMAVVNAVSAPAALPSHPAAAGWPTVDVLHLREMAAGPTLLQWLPRYLDTYQTRLLIVECEPTQLGATLQLAQTLVERGGPAVFVAADPALNWNAFYRELVHDRPLDWIRSLVRGGALFAGAQREELLRYSRLALAFAAPSVVLDIVGGLGTPRLGGRGLPPPPSSLRGIDLTALSRAAIEGALRSLRVPTLDPRDHRYRLNPPPLTAKGGPFKPRLDFSFFNPTRRLRFTSLVGAGLSERGVHAPGVERTFDAMLASQGSTLDSDAFGAAIASGAVNVQSLDRSRANAVVASKLRSITALQPMLSYESHESEGMLPLAGKVADARALLRRLGTTPTPTRRRRAVRHVNAAFFTDAGSGRLRKLAPASARLRAGELVHLGVQIGVKDRLLATVGSTALIEELQRSPEGIWLEIGVTAYDFELIGEPVQPLWLPPTGATDLATFALRVPQSTPNEGVARVRFSIYCRNNVVQSFLVAARLDTPVTVAAANLARVLGVRAARIAALGHPGYVTRLEYRARAIDAAEAGGERALSIVANDNAGQKVLTLKGDELFQVTSNANIEDTVRDMRDALDRASRNKRQEYRYIFRNELNRGNPDELLDALWDVALAGWQLFDTLVPGQTDKQDVLDRLDGGLGVHAAHIDITNVIPWALVYDRPVSDRQLLADPLNPAAPLRPVTRALCRAALPSLDGSAKCGGVGCLLHPAENQRRQAQGEPLVCEETVICPQRFWGFRVPIEVPVQQVQGVGGQVPPSIRTQIASAKPLVFVAALNPNLDRRLLGDAEDGTHGRNLRDLVARASARYVPPPRDDRGAVIDLLATEQPDVVYLYCHGVTGAKAASGRRIGDSLDFGRGHDGVVTDLVESSDLNGKDWTHGPLVFLNGCSTVGFKSYAPSTFIKKFIQGRKASAVIGTEVTVWEALAREFAETYFGAMLATRQPGQSLLIARRALMAKDNPLGLVYTLYGSIDLTV